MSSCRLTAVRSDPVTPQSPTLQGPLCAWQNCKLLPVALEALLNQPCRPWPHLSALTSPSPVGLGLTCQPWPHLSALTSPSPVGHDLTCRPWPHLSALASPVSLNLTLTCWPWPHLLPPLPAHCPPAGFPPAFGSLWQTAGCSPPPAPASSSGISQGTGDILLLQSQRGGAALPCKTS